eukprot:scaffold1275_cov401-Prasinococcus_capsulatus_cf.AAC.8
MKTLKSVEILKSLTMGQLQRLTDMLSESTYRPGEYIIRQGTVGKEFFVLQSGNVSCTVDERARGDSGSSSKTVMKLGPGDYFGERALLNDTTRAANVIADTDVKCLYIQRSTFTEVLGPLQHIIDADRRWRESNAARQQESLRAMEHHPYAGSGAVQRSDFAWQATLVSDGSMRIGAVRHIKRKDHLTLKLVSTGVASEKNQQEMVMREAAVFEGISRALLTHMVPTLVCKWSDSKYLCTLLHSSCSCTLLDLISVAPLGENAVRFLTATMLLALQSLHRADYLFRGISSGSLLIDNNGLTQICEVRFCKRIDGGNSYTMCGEPDYMAPEMINRSGHGQPVDVWALGVLVYELLCGEYPFASDGPDGELALFKQIAARDLQYPPSFSTSGKAFVDVLLCTDASARPTIEQTMEMDFFSGFPWDALKSRNTAAAPPEIIARIQEMRQAHSGPLVEGNGMHDGCRWTVVTLELSADPCRCSWPTDGDYTGPMWFQDF